MKIVRQLLATQICQHSTINIKRLSKLTYLQMNEIIRLHTGIETSSKAHLNLSERQLFPLISAHGLGSKNPKNRNHDNDEWLPIFDEGRKLIGNDVPYIVYTARGHGESNG